MFPFVISRFGKHAYFVQTNNTSQYFVRKTALYSIALLFSHEISLTVNTSSNSFIPKMMDAGLVNSLFIFNPKG